MDDISVLRPADKLAKFGLHSPNGSTEYRKARTALLTDGIELHRHIERAAEQRRALPPGGKIPEDYQLVGEMGQLEFSEMFGPHDTLVTYNYMFGPPRQRPCPMCTNLLSTSEGNANDVQQRVALAVIARSPIEKLVAIGE